MKCREIVHHVDFNAKTVRRLEMKKEKEQEEDKMVKVSQNERIDVSGN